MNSSRQQQSAGAAEGNARAIRYCALAADGRRAFGRPCRSLWLLLLGLLFGTAAPLRADDFLTVLVDSVATGPTETIPYNKKAGGWYRANFANGAPTVLIEGNAEAYVDCAPERDWTNWQSGAMCNGMTLLVRRSAAADLHGRLVIVDPNGIQVRAFKLQKELAGVAGNERFLRARLRHYEYLAQQPIAGAALFRHEVAETQKMLGRKPLAGSVRPAGPNTRDTDLEKTFALFSGGRAVSENLQLDRALFPSDESDQTVSLESLRGIETQAFDWKPLLGATVPEFDPLAARVPADQYAAFFPSYAALQSVLDEAHATLGTMVRGMEDRAEFADVRGRYQQQVCLPSTVLTQFVAPYLISDLVITGSDPWFRTGTDVAIILNSKNAEALLTAITAEQESCLGRVKGAARRDGRIGEVEYRAVINADRRLSSYASRIGNMVIVSNSRVQLERVLSVSQPGHPAIDSLDEYRFFRSRYKRGTDDEVALLVLPDGAIRKWVGPQWRIAESRRIRAAAALGELQLKYAPAILKGSAAEEALDKTESASSLGALHVGAGGVRSEMYNTTEFLTPIIELNVEKVSPRERDAYARFRDSYQSYWKRYFDPIAVEVRQGPGRLSLDATVMPLIAATDYNFLRELTAGAALDQFSGDAHTDSLGEFTVAMDSTSEVFQRNTAPVGQLFGGAANPLGWIGKSITLYLDPSPVLQKIVEAEVPQAELEKLYSTFPVGLHIEVRDSLRLATFLTTIRTFSEQSVPGLTLWDKMEYHGVPYVRVHESRPPVTRDGRSNAPAWSIYYAATPEALIITLDEALLQRSLDRLQARNSGAARAELNFGLGAQVRTTMKRALIESFEQLAGYGYVEHLRQRCYGNLPILNEWKRRYPDRDPLAVHRTLLNTVPVCPAGGEYVWNESLGTMESTVAGSPANLKPLGRSIPFLAQVRELRSALTFEHDGIRAILELVRDGGADR